MSSTQLISGFDPTKMTSVSIVSKDCKKYGINPDDFAKYDKNHDGLVDANEFLYGGGLGCQSIFNAFKTLAESSQAYVDETKSKDGSQTTAANGLNEINGPSQTNPILAGNNENKSVNQQYSLFHPSVENHPDLAKNMDVMG